MSDIWHKAGFHEAIDDKLKVSKDGKWVYWTMYGWNIPGKDVHDIGCEWAYIDDLLALETELERTRKALDVAINAMKSAGTHNSINCIARGEDPSKDDVGITINHALEQITSLEQKE